jgi:ComF family protein
MKRVLASTGRLLFGSARSLYLSALDFIYAPLCPLCDTVLTDGRMPLCHACQAQLPRLSRPFTPPGGAKHAYDAVHAVYDYCPEIQQLVHSLKYHGRRELACALGRDMGRMLAGLGMDCAAAIVPVPLHPRRARERGYNQSVLLARAAATVCSLPVQDALLLRQRETAPQARLSREQRDLNVRGAFALAPRHRMDLPATVILVDDVFTTGSTLNECARVLVKGGVESVICSTLARVLLDIT